MIYKGCIQLTVVLISLQLTGRLLALIREPIAHLPGAGRGEPGGAGGGIQPCPGGTAGWLTGAACVPSPQCDIPQEPRAPLPRRMLDIWVSRELRLKHHKMLVGYIQRHLHSIQRHLWSKKHLGATFSCVKLPALAAGRLSKAGH